MHEMGQKAKGAKESKKHNDRSTEIGTATGGKGLVGRVVNFYFRNIRSIAKLLFYF